tara:strand:- start:1542 stop:1898 length:357 start_codon:yes stop_codon:yes gene_type:complete
MPAQTIKSIRRLRREVNRLTDRNNELQNSKQEEVSARRTIEKELQKRDKQQLKDNDRYQKVKTELNQVSLKVANLQRAVARLRKEKKEAEQKYQKEVSKKANAIETVKRIRQALRSPA